MAANLGVVKAGLALVLMGLLFGVSLGIAFGTNEDGIQEFIAEGIAAHPELHTPKSKDSIWRYAQRAHFHATGIAAYSLGLIALVVFSGLTARYKSLCALLIGCGAFYPLSWFTMFLLAPAIGREAAHNHVFTEAFAYLGVGGTLAGLLLLAANLFFGMFAEDA